MTRPNAAQSHPVKVSLGGDTGGLWGSECDKAICGPKPSCNGELGEGGGGVGCESGGLWRGGGGAGGV